MSLDELILQILKRENISDQETLQIRLKQRGEVVNQSTLSRRMKKLGITKQDGRYVTSQKPTVVHASQLVLSPPNLILLKTLPAHAHAVGYRVDALGIEQIAGTIAGDDTLMIAVKHPDFLQAVKEKLEVFLESQP